MYDSYYGGYGYSTPSNYSYYTRTPSKSALGVLAGLGAAFWLIMIVLGVLTAVGLWKIFKKAGHNGWESLIAGHNVFLELEMSGIKGYWFFLLYVPIANIVVTFWKNIELAKSFGKSTAFGVLMSFFPYICIPILGLGNSQYLGPAYHENVGVNYQYSNNNFNGNNFNQNQQNVNYNGNNFSGNQPNNNYSQQSSNDNQQANSSNEKNSSNNDTQADNNKDNNK